MPTFYEDQSEAEVGAGHGEEGVILFLKDCDGVEVQIEMENADLLSLGQQIVEFALSNIHPEDDGDDGSDAMERLVEQESGSIQRGIDGENGRNEVIANYRAERGVTDWPDTLPEDDAPFD